MKLLKFKLLLITLMVFLNCISFGQSEKNFQTIFSENFNSNENSWDITNAAEFQNYISNSGKYVLNHPLNTYFGFTRIQIPDVLNTVNVSENSSIKFDLEILKSDLNGNFGFGLIFDWHDSPSSTCTEEEDTGGDFYLIMIKGNSRFQTMTAEILQRENCEWKTLIPSVRNSAYDSSVPNKVEIEKNGSAVDVIVNNVIVTSFEYAADYNFSKFYFSRGEYAIDNINIQKINYSFSADQVISNIPQSKKPRIYILLAGISNYSNPNYLIGNLKAPIKDINSIRSFYLSVNGGATSEANIVYLPNEQATSENILRNASELFSKANQNDVIISYLSGHGGVGYFCAYDKPLQYERINLIINSSPAKKLFIVDACHAGSWDASSVLTSKGQTLTEQEALDLFYKKLMASGENSSNWLLACRPDEFSADMEDNGLFTKYLLSGLNGDADKIGNSDQIVTLDEVYIYLTQEFTEWNRNNEGRFWTGTNVPLKMNPVLMTSGNRNIPLSVVLENPDK